MKPELLFENLAYEEVNKAFSWVNRDGAPRDECFMSTVYQGYTYGRGRGVRTYFPIEYSDLIDEIRNKVNDATGVSYEACFANKYEGNRHHLGWHSDDSGSIDHTEGIPIVSFGAEREIWFREIGSKEVEKVSLPHGSVIVMPAGFQQTHQHRIPKHGSICDPRISLTFRKLS